jgi:hypothetical protein
VTKVLNGSAPEHQDNRYCFLGVHTLIL